MKKFTVMIPARGGSKGIKKKNLQEINGMPMVAYAIAAAKAAPSIGNVFVSTEDKEIKKAALLYGANVIDRPQMYAEDHSSTESVIQHFFTKNKVGALVVIQPTSPMLLAGDLENGILRYQEGKYDSMFSAYKTNDELIWEEDGMYPINYDPRNRGRRQTRKRHILHENGAFFIFSRKMFLRTGCRMGGKIGWSEMPYERSFQIDSMQDLKRVRTLMTLKG